MRRYSAAVSRKCCRLSVAECVDTRRKSLILTGAATKVSLLRDRRCTKESRQHGTQRTLTYVAGGLLMQSLIEEVLK